MGPTAEWSYNGQQRHEFQVEISTPSKILHTPRSISGLRYLLTFQAFTINRQMNSSRLPFPITLPPFPDLSEDFLTVSYEPSSFHETMPSTLTNFLQLRSFPRNSFFGTTILSFDSSTVSSHILLYLNAQIMEVEQKIFDYSRVFRRSFRKIPFREWRRSGRRFQEISFFLFDVKREIGRRSIGNFVGMG